MCVLSRSSKTIYGASEEKQMYEESSILVFRDFGVGAKFGNKIKSVYGVSGRKWHQNSGGIQKYILVAIFIIITNLCT